MNLKNFCLKAKKALQHLYIVGRLVGGSWLGGWIAAIYINVRAHARTKFF